MTREAMDALYGENYFEDAERNYSYSDQVDEVYSSFLVTASRFRDYLSGGRLLDVGCATGEFIELANKSGFDAMGIDPSGYAVSKARSRGLNVVQGTLYDLSRTEEMFDGIHLSHVLEHFDNPTEAMEVIRARIVSSGILYVEVPNQFNSILDVINRVKRQRKTFDVFSVHHRSFFTCKALNILLQKKGFEIISHTTYRPETRRRGFRRRVVLNGILRVASLFNGGDLISVWARAC